MPASRDLRTRPQNLLTTRDLRARHTVGPGLSTARGTPPPQRNSSTPIHLRPETSPLSLPPPSSPSVGCSQIVAMERRKWLAHEEVKNVPLDPRLSERKWLTREEVKKLPKMRKIKCGAQVTLTCTSVSESKSKFTTSTPVTKMPLTPPGYPLESEQRFDSSGFEKTTRPCTSASATQTDTCMTLPITPQWSRSIEPNSTHAIPTNGPPCSESSQIVSLPVTAPSAPTTDFASLSLSSDMGSSLPSSAKNSNLQGCDRLNTPWGRNGVQATSLSQMKETKERPRTPNASPDLQGTSPPKDARAISSQVQRSSPLAPTVTDSEGRTTQRVANSPYTTVISNQQTRSRKEFNMDSYNSCDCRSNGGPECDYCRILKRVSEFCERVDHAVKEN